MVSRLLPSPLRRALLKGGRGENKKARRGLNRGEPFEGDRMIAKFYYPCKT